MTSIADQLPPEIAQRVHPDWRKNEAAYWRVRDQMVVDYRDQWIGFADGAVIAAGHSPVDVFQRAQESGRHPYFTCVGRENEPCRIRRCSFAYDTAYPGEPLPVLQVEFRTISGKPGMVLNRVIADTGADASVLPWMDCQLLQLDPADGLPGTIGGVGGSSTGTLSFHVSAWLDGNEYPCRLQADFTGNERILGRDVLNRVDILFRGIAGEVVVNP